MIKTKAPKPAEIKRQWHLVDVNGQVLGRIATQIAEKLIGKDKTNYAANIDCGDYVVVINAENIKVTGRKENQKMYYSHSNYPGGFKALTFKQVMDKDPRKIIEHAVKNMLPKNKLQSPRLKRLKIFADANHIYQDKFKNQE
jgi:large subunit ribosomal protein L13